MQHDDKTAARAAKLEHAPLPRMLRDIRDISAASPRLFSTQPYQAHEQFEVWKTRMASLLEVAPPPGHDSAQGFKVEYLTCNMADVLFTSGRFAAQIFARAPRSSQRPRVDYWWLFRVRSGEAWFENGERRLHARPGAMFLISLDDDIKGRITEYDGLVLGLPRGAFSNVAAQLDSVCNLILSGNLIELLIDYLDRLEMRLSAMSPDELRQAGRATANMIATCIQPSAEAQAQDAIEPLLFSRACHYIETNLGDFDLTPDRVARQLRSSRSNLYRAFENVGGVASYILRKRLRAAHAELTGDTDRRVQEIAYRHGFKLASHFTRAFRREFGISPREARARRRRG